MVFIGRMGRCSFYGFIFQTLGCHDPASTIVAYNAYRIRCFIYLSIEVITDSIGRGQQGDHVHKFDKIVKDKGCSRIY